MGPGRSRSGLNAPVQLTRPPSTAHGPRGTHGPRAPPRQSPCACPLLMSSGGGPRQPAECGPLGADRARVSSLSLCPAHALWSAGGHCRCPSHGLDGLRHRVHGTLHGRPGEQPVRLRGWFRGPARGEAAQRVRPPPARKRWLPEAPTSAALLLSPPFLLCLSLESALAALCPLCSS